MFYFVVGFVIGGLSALFFYRYRLRQDAREAEIKEKPLYPDQHKLLESYRSSIEQELFLRSPDRFCEFIVSCSALTARFLAQPNNVKREKLFKLIDKYPWVSSFDIKNAKNYLPLYVGFDGYSTDELEEEFINNLHYCLLNYPDFITFDQWESTYDTLKEHAANHNDTQLLWKAKTAYNLYLDTKEYLKDDHVWETKWFKIERVPHLVELCYGITFLTENAFVLVAVFIDKKIYTSFYKSDSNFEEREWFDNFNSELIQISVSQN